ncbi:Nucleolar and coiled-body phosphoprotein 1 [Linum perenne]
MPQTHTTARVGGGLNIINPSLLALKPRQVSLLINSRKMSAAVKTPAVLNPHQKTILLQSIALYLQRSGYSKTLKKFRSESNLQIDNSEGSGFYLEDLLCKFLETSDQGCKKSETLACKRAYSAEAEKSAGNDEEIKSVDEGKSKSTNDLETNKKSKKKSKKLSSNLVKDNGVSVSEEKKEVVSNKDLASDIVENSDKARVKKQKKSKSSMASQNLSSADAEKDDALEETLESEKQESKKRKRSSSQEVSTLPADDAEPVEKSKRQRTEDAEKVSNTDQKPKSENSSFGTSDNIQIPESNGQVIQDLEKKEQKKSTKKQQNGSSEPTTAQRFQRVKADEVVFSDERLKDNSYWAKDGAEIGYGAKAQEVLGQVKGKGFRHEKTKKKRGSYRGGQIDQNTHSVKFNYSDEE